MKSIDFLGTRSLSFRRSQGRSASPSSGAGRLRLRDTGEGGARGADRSGLGLRDGLDRGRLPRGSGRELDGTAGEKRPAPLIRIARRQGHFDPGDHLGDPGGDLDQGHADGVELSVAPERGFGRQAAQRVQKPIGGGVDQQAELIGRRAGAGGAIGGEVQLVRLDQVFCLAARAVDVLVQPARRAGEVGDDEAAVAALRRASTRPITRRSTCQLLAA